MIDSLSSHSTIQTGNTAAAKATMASDLMSKPAKNSDAPASQAGSQTISTLARQLAASASRAEERDKTLTRSELADKAKSALSQIQGDAYFANKAKHDSEVPKTNDPELLARAKQATAYVNSAARGEVSDKNPFAGLSREQLANIIYDDSGTYTVNERRAAAYEADRQEEAWRVKVITKAMDEYNRTGKLTDFFTSVLDHFKELPAIEQAQYPADYASDLQSKIDRGFNYRNHQAEGKGRDPMNVIAMLLQQSPQQVNELRQKPENTTDTATVRETP